MKDFLLKLKAAKEQEIVNTRELIKNSDSADEVRALGETLDKLVAELNELEEKLVEAEKDEGNNDGADDQEEGRNKAPTNESRGFNPLQTLGGFNMNNQNIENKEYRLAFAKLVTKGTPIPAELRANANTLTSDVAGVIPENLIPEIITTIESYGNVLPLITKTSYAVGQSIPVDGVKPTATWVGEGATSDKQKKTMGTSIVFGAYKLRCEVSFSQEVSVQSLPAFEALFVKQVGQAMAKAIEAKVVSNNATSGSPRGILAETGKSVEYPATGLDYASLCAAEGELPSAYEAGAKWFMNKKTFMSIVALVDNNKQPIARVNYGLAGKPERILLGRDVVITEHLLVGEAFIFDPSDYVLNTSYDLGIQRKTDWDTEDHMVKGVMSVDGKVIDATSLVKLAKAKAAS